MFRSRRGEFFAGFLMGASLLAAPPAQAFELFGFHLWGKPEDDGRVDVIDPLDYSVKFNVSPDEDGLKSTLQSASALWTNRDEPASGKAGLISRAKGDYRRLLAALYNAGYYGGEISILIAGREASDLTLNAEFPAPAAVSIAVAPGPRFAFDKLAFVNPPPPPRRRDPKTFETIGFERGKPARASVIGAASALAIQQWRDDGHALAQETSREVVADHATSKLDVTLALDPGREAVYGPITVEGNSRTKSDFIAFMTGLPTGKRFSAKAVEDAQARLGRLGIFRSFRIEEGKEIEPDGSLPITVRVEDRRPRTVGFGATLSTLDGVGIQSYWMHRNLFGRGERLRFDASISGLGVQNSVDNLDYTAGISFTKPGVYTPDTNFVAGILAQQLDFDTYRERSLGANVGLTQQFGDRLTGDISANVTKARFDDAFGRRNFMTYALIGNLAYDIRNDKLDATRGYYVAAMLQPFYEADYGNAAIRGTLEGRVYHSVIGPNTLVLAGRALFGTYWGPSAAESPPDLLFFAGGGGSVRGYAYRSIGVQTTVNGEPATIGGRGLFESSVEARYRINQSFGAVGFVDSGFVTENPKLSGDTDLRFGVGAGLRYYTSFGPLRVDLATPVNGRSDDAKVALYIGIGQAF